MLGSGLTGRHHESLGTSDDAVGLNRPECRRPMCALCCGVCNGRRSSGPTGSFEAARLGQPSRSRVGSARSPQTGPVIQVWGEAASFWGQVSAVLRPYAPLPAD